MKVNYMIPVKGLSGKKDLLVYYVDKESGTAYCRDYVIPEETENNRNMADISTNIGLFYHSVSGGYISDLKNYCDRYALMVRRSIGRLNSNTALIKMLYRLRKAVPTVNLVTITPVDVVAGELPVRTVREAVEYGILPIVSRYEELDHPILID
jgi:hypothetical protein